MRVLLTGATGVIGRETVPLLTKGGHDVLGLSRSAGDRDWLAGVGARPVEADLFDPSSVDDVLTDVDAVLHFATAIPPRDEMTKRDAWRTNDRLRTVATANLVDAALKHGVGRFVQESITFFYADGGEAWIDEGFPVDPTWDILDSALDAEGEVTRFNEGGGVGISLRMSSLYGPGRASAELIASVAQRKAPIVGAGANFVSHLHVEDAATAIAASLEAPAGTYNVSDGEPVTSRQDLESLAAALGVKAPRHVPSPVARVAAGRASGLLTRSQRVSNRNFKQTTGWDPRYRSVLEGWASVVAGWQAA